MVIGADEKVPSELKKAIMQGRMDKKLTQAQLAKVGLACFPNSSHLYNKCRLIISDH